ncbi:hypothetical protein FEM48_Zijuj12G0208100 [Ziziphus jujuba var. spinosa]|uniref:Transcription factor MYB108-like n=1 Tax=Ziziphus jujuba var. spinosa TaxID=714518 RepID=A0A978UFG8_ZIZJJ|nr:hypothetical protein FEM48_Zijuj12G0208100 [Ziziphus jujuba var. spinosa]
MDVQGRSSISVCNDTDILQNDEDLDLRRGPWTVEEDLTLINYIANHGEGRWNSLARCAGLKRTGKSCRLRWLNYLRPDVRRGNITLEEQLLILELHSRWGNRWSKIAQHLPGRTDNEIKNYWRTRVQKHAKQLKCDVNSKQFKDTMRYLWMPRLVERIQAASASASVSVSSSVTGTGPSPVPSTTGITASSHHHHLFNNHNNNNSGFRSSGQFVLPKTSIGNDFGGSQVTPSYTPDNSSTAASSDSFGTPVSDLTDYYSAIPINNNHPNPDNYFQAGYGGGGQVGNYSESMTSPAAAGYYNPGLDFQAMDQININNWMDSDDASDSLWNVEDIWFLQPHHLNTTNI